MANREYIRVSTASRLLAGYFHEHGTNLRGSSVVGCGRWKAYGRDSANAEILVDGNGARFDGHFKCGSVWTCDHCARARVSQTRSWIRAALIPALEAKNLSAAMMTFTMAHTYAGDWKVSIDMLHAAYKIFDRNMSMYYKKLGGVGKLKSLEAPVGANGIHGHFHVLITHDQSADMSSFEAKARATWARAVAAVGGNCNHHGFDLKLNAVADYLAKHDVAHEMASHGTKQARSKGLLLGQLLDKAAIGDTKASAEWLRAVQALQGRSRFHAGDIAAKLGIPTCTEWEDDERQQAQVQVNANMPQPVRITYPLRDHLKATRPDCKRPGLAMILRAARGGDSNRVVQMVAALCREVDSMAQKNAALTGTPVLQSFWDWPEDYWDKLIEEVCPIDPCISSGVTSTEQHQPMHQAQ